MNFLRDQGVGMPRCGTHNSSTIIILRDRMGRGHEEEEEEEEPEDNLKPPWVDFATMPHQPIAC